MSTFEQKQIEDKKVLLEKYEKYIKVTHDDQIKGVLENMINEYDHFFLQESLSKQREEDFREIQNRIEAIRKERYDLSTGSDFNRGIFHGIVLVEDELEDCLKAVKAGIQGI